MRLYAALTIATCIGSLFLIASRTTPCPEPVAAKERTPTVASPRIETEEIERALGTDVWTPRQENRNLFAYVEGRKPVGKTLSIPQQPPAQVTTVASTAVEKREPELAYRYLGTFGRSNDPIAVFTRDGDVINAHAGDRLGEFSVEQVRFEGVAVRAAGADAPRTLPNRR